MVFVVLEGEITVILHTTQFNAKKGDSFYIPPKVGLKNDFLAKLKLDQRKVVLLCIVSHLSFKLIIFIFQNYYNLINQKAREAELSLIQFQYDGPLPTVQPSAN